MKRERNYLGIEYYETYLEDTVITSRLKLASRQCVVVETEKKMFDKVKHYMTRMY